MVAQNRIPGLKGEYKQYPRWWQRRREDQAAELVYDFHMALDAGKLTEAQSVYGELETGYAWHPLVAGQLATLRDSLEDALEWAHSVEEKGIWAKETREWLKSEPLAAFTSLVARNGKYKGEIVEMTVKRALRLQHRDALNAPDRARSKRNGGHVPWEYCLDQVASEAGYTTLDRGDEAFRKGVEKIARIKRKLADYEKG